jgi:hypothetical protein
MADQLQQVLLRVVEKEGSCGHGRKRDWARTKPEDFESFFVSLVTLWRDLEGQVIQCRSTRLVPVEASLGKDVPLEVDQRQQLRMTIPAKRRIDPLDGQECYGRFSVDIWLGASLVASFTQQLETENLSIEIAHSRQIANIENDLGDPGYRGHRVHRVSLPNDALSHAPARMRMP